MMRITDDEIKKKVVSELRWDTRVAGSEIEVIVKDGAVTLLGWVDSYAKKIAAQRGALRVYGVSDVANELVVKLSGDHVRTDAEIAQTVRRALEWNVMVPAKRIYSSVSDGRITLTGTVDYLSEREDAERAVGQLPGVREIFNQIAVRGRGIKEEEVRSIIEDAIERRADREAGRIKVNVYDGVVTLSGKVRNWAEKRAIFGAVSHTPGIHTVHDHLHIDME